MKIRPFLRSLLASLLVAALAARDWPVELVAIGDPGLLADRGRATGRAVAIETFAADAVPLPSRAGRLRCLPIPIAAPVEAGRLDPHNAAHVVAMLQAAGPFRTGSASPEHRPIPRSSFSVLRIYEEENR